MSATAYPATEREDLVEVLHGVPIADPYRWLEDPASERTKRWVAAQNELTNAYLAGCESRPWFAERMREVLGAPQAGTPHKRGGWYLVTRNNGSQDQDVLFAARDLAELVAGGRVLVDPNQLSDNGRVALAGYAVSPDGRWLAYGTSEAGSDWIEWRVREIETGTDTPDRVTHSKFCVAEWLPDASGFLYWAYPDHERTTGDDATELSGGVLLLHRLGADQDQDEPVHHNPAEPRERADAEVTEDGRWLVLSFVVGTDRRKRLAVRRIHEDGTFGPVLPVVPEAHSLYELAGSDGDVLYLRTDYQAPRYRLVAVDLAALADGRDAWRELVPERDAVLTMAGRAGAGFIVGYLDDAAHRVWRLALDGTELAEVPLAGPVSVVGGYAKAGDDEVFLGLESFLHRTRAYRLDMATGSIVELRLVDNGSDVSVPTVTERHRAISQDGTEVPYFLVRRADLPTDQPQPTLLYGYGGFNIALTPSFRAAWPAWVAAGGVLVVANLRGGGEFGREWHEAGTRERKQNVFDDFVAVAKDLFATGVTAPERLALHGGSNGGLLVGAVMTQHPELAAVALPAVGVLDMLRFHRFTIGWAWISDYGDPENPADFEVLRAYSPLHNLREGVSYPATLVLTGDHDDRVVPAHSHKFIAQLQHVQAGPAPVLARIETAAGHGFGKPRSVLAAEIADTLAFAAEHTGLVPAKLGN
ncbi:MAG TPA: prolyl oligopeptidase family serine peptidase [Natronosporangium sp.]